MATPLRLKRLFIEKLFGEGSHNIDIPFKLDERVTILHGLNGSGKTITLNLLQAVWEGRYEALLDYPLTVMRLEFDDRSVLELRPTQASSAPVANVGEGRPRLRGGKVARLDDLNQRRRVGPPTTEVNIRLRLPGEQPHEQAIVGLKRMLDFEHIEAGLSQLGLYVRQVGPDLYHDVERGDTLTERQLIVRYGNLLRQHASMRGPSGAELPRLRKWRAQLVPMKFIRTDRLFIREEDRLPNGPTRLDRVSGLRHMVELLSARLRDEVQAADQAYRVASTQLDTSLAERILEPVADAPSTEALLNHAATLGALEARLREVGLFHQETKPLPRKIDEHQRATIHVILQDREAKLKPFEPLVNKAERLLKSLNQKLAPKQVKLDLNQGYQVVAASGEVLDLTQLSSGEQHELVLLHELLFDVRPGSLILIDEPELSLHVTWQATLLEELLDIAKLVDIHFVLATHSPYIVGEHDELMVQLGRSASDTP